MKTIIDECVPSIVKTRLIDRDIVTVQDMGWAGVKNGELLKLVVAEFDVLLLRTRTYATSRTSRLSM
jgi:hypothetical protein